MDPDFSSLSAEWRNAFRLRRQRVLLLTLALTGVMGAVAFATVSLCEHWPGIFCLT